MKYQIESEIVTDMRKKKDKVRKLNTDMTPLTLERATEKKRFENKIVALVVVVAPAEVKSLLTCAELVSRIRSLEQDFMDFVQMSLENAVAQIKIMNSSVALVTEAGSYIKWSTVR